MLYWLFTDFKDIATILVFPLMCFAIPMPIVTTLMLGAGIQRHQGEISSKKLWIKWFTIALVLLTVTTIFVMVTADLAIQPMRGRQTNNGLILLLSGAPNTINHMRLFMFGTMLVFIWFIVILVLHSGMKNGGWLHEQIDRLRTPRVNRGALGSSHFCTQREYKRFRREDPEGLTLLGAFWGDKKRRLDSGTGQFCLGGEDISRGILTLGGPGSGKTQGIILPAIADRMLLGHSLVVADPQGEITHHILKYAKVTRHLVVVHDPTSSVGPRYNLSEGIQNVSDARAIADVLVPTSQGDNKFWSDSAAALLAACLIRFPNLGEIYNAMNDLKELANKLAAKKDVPRSTTLKDLAGILQYRTKFVCKYICASACKPHQS